MADKKIKTHGRSVSYLHNVAWRLCGWQAETLVSLFLFSITLLPITLEQ
jgi:hypothetical protein